MVEYPPGKLRVVVAADRLRLSAFACCAIEKLDDLEGPTLVLKATTSDLRLWQSTRVRIRNERPSNSALLIKSIAQQSLMSAIKSRLCDAHPPADLSNRCPTLGLPQGKAVLLHGKPLSRHGTSSGEECVRKITSRPNHFCGLGPGLSAQKSLHSRSESKIAA